MMKPRKRGGSRSAHCSLTINDESKIGFKPSRIIKHFSFKNTKHVVICMLIIIVTLSITVFSHWLLNDFDEIEHKQRQEIEQIEDLFYDEHVWMQRSHERAVESMQSTHEKDMDKELKWFLDEMNAITFVLCLFCMHHPMLCVIINSVKQEMVRQEHKEAEYKLNATARIHDYHSAEQKKLDEKLNAMYVESGDKIEYVNKRMAECKAKATELDTKLTNLRPKQELRSKSGAVPENYYKYAYKQEN